MDDLKLNIARCGRLLSSYIYIYMELQPQFLASVLWRCLKKYCCLAHGKRQCLKCYNGLVYPYSCSKHGFVVGFFCWIVSPFFSSSYDTFYCHVICKGLIFLLVLEWFIIATHMLVCVDYNNNWNTHGGGLHMDCIVTVIKSKHLLSPRSLE